MTRATTTTAAPLAPVTCVQEEPDGTDDCSPERPRKLDCATADEQRTAIAAGCVAERADRASDRDVCCPTTVVAPRALEQEVEEGNDDEPEARDAGRD